jgi:hypothetical protein
MAKQVLTIAAAVVATSAASFGWSSQAQAATAAGCEGGGFTVVLPGGGTVSTEGETIVPAAALGAGFLVRGRYIEFMVVSSTSGSEITCSQGLPTRRT